MKHQPVLLPEILQLLDPQPGETYLDATAGYGGHAALIAQKVGERGRLILVDRDSDAIRELGQTFGDKAELIRSSYLEAAQKLLETGEMVDMILLDLGVSSPQIDNPERGFSFQADGPLDMRMDQTQRLTAAEVVNSYSREQLKDLIKRYGEEPRAGLAASAIVRERPFTTTAHLAKVVAGAVKYSAGKIHPATRVFQALRIEVNNELEQLRRALPLFLKLLSPGGRLAVISFHSLEDRIVKQFIETEGKDCICPPQQPICTCKHRASLDRLTKGAIQGKINDNNNPRARSAKLRAARKK